MIVKPIQTEYNGYKFRSRLEARWAVVFDKLGLEWYYENEGYEIEGIGNYLPDFEVVTKDGKHTWFIEVKGNRSDVMGLRKAKAMDNVVIESIEPTYMGCLVFGKLNFMKDGPLDVRHQMLSVPRNDFNKAIRAGRKARFEFGETPII